MITAAVVALAALGGPSWLTVALLLPSLYLVDTGLLWGLYLAISSLDRARRTGRLPPEAVPCAKVLLVIGYLDDIIYNWTWAIIVFADAPRELLVTARLSRYKYGRSGVIGWRRFEWLHAPRAYTWPPATGWRLARTVWHCDNMLDPFDAHPSGLHVRP